MLPVVEFDPGYAGQYPRAVAHIPAIRLRPGYSRGLRRLVMQKRKAYKRQPRHLGLSGRLRRRW